MGWTNPEMDYLRPTASGDFLNKNPYIDAMYDQAAGRVGAPIDSRFTAAGRYGSGAHQGVLGQTFGDLATNIYGQNYAQERQNMLAAGQSLIGAGQNQQTSRLSAANQLGSNYDTARGLQTTAATNAPSWTTNAALSPFASFNAMSDLTKLGVKSTTSPYFTNPVGGALSGALAGYGLSKAL